MKRTLAGQSLTKACEAEGITRVTYYNWTRNEEFMATVRHYLAEISLAGQTLALESWPEVVREIVRIATGEDPKARAADRVRAAEFLFQVAGVQVIEGEETQRRQSSILDALAQKLGGSVKINVGVMVNNDANDRAD